MASSCNALQQIQYSSFDTLRTEIMPAAFSGYLSCKTRCHIVASWGAGVCASTSAKDKRIDINLRLLRSRLMRHLRSPLRANAVLAHSHTPRSDAFAGGAGTIAPSSSGFQKDV